METPSVKLATALVLDVAYESVNDDSADTVVLLHGFPYDPRAFDQVVPMLAERGKRVIVPYLRGFGPTRFRDPTTLRSGQQAALGHDLVELMDALGVNRAVVAGYDWGGRAACVAAAVFPERVVGLVSANAYNIQHIASSSTPIAPEAEATFWYQYYFQTARGRRGMEQNPTGWASCCGGRGRRRGRARPRRSPGRAPASTTPISSTLSSTRIGTASGRSTVTRGTNRRRDVSRPSRTLRYRRSSWRAWRVGSA